MKKRLTFQCGKCKRNFSFQQEITEEQELLFACPYCGAELVLKLEPFKKRKKTTVRGEGNDAESFEWEYIFPDVIQSELRNP
ncbi:MAG: hypothetical protein HKUEN02_19720 [Anaerolineaceae bacterium]|nr:MAG: hypothetical protein HKUEN02_19720 [Anaerolineaceae bacterium]